MIIFEKDGVIKILVTSTLDELILEKVTADEFNQKFKLGATVMTGFEPFQDVSHTMLYLVQFMAKMRDEHGCKTTIICADTHSALHGEIGSTGSYKLWKMFGFEPKLASEYTKDPEYQRLLGETTQKINEKHALKGFPTKFREDVKAGIIPKEEIDRAVTYVRLEVTDFRYFKPDLFIGGTSQRKYVGVSRDRIYKQTAALIAPALDLEGNEASFYRSGPGLISLNNDSPEEIRRKVLAASDKSIADIQKRIFSGTREEIADYFCKINQALNEKGDK